MINPVGSAAMWWRRRPTPVLSAPAPRGALRTLSPPLLFGVIAVTLTLAWAMPLLGVSLGTFLLIDVALGERARRRHGAAVAP